MLLRVTNKIITFYGFCRDTEVAESNDAYMGLTFKLVLAKLARLG